MDKNRLIKLLAIILIIGLAFWQLYPSLKYYRLSPEERELEKELRDRAIHLGLDLQGGMHLVLEVDTKDMAAREANSAVEGALIVIRRRIEDKFPSTEAGEEQNHHSTSWDKGSGEGKRTHWEDSPLRVQNS